MSQVVLVRCPSCGQKLRVPTEWLAQSVRCKHCQKSFQIKGQAKRPGADAAPLIRRGRRPATSNDSVFWKLSLAVGALAGLALGIFIAAQPHSGGPASTKAVVAERKIPTEPPKNKSNPDTPTDVPVKKAEPVSDPEETTPQPIEPKLAPEPPKKEPPTPPPVQGKDGPFPRRALLINVSNYLLFNPLHYGSPRDGMFSGSSTAALADTLSRPPMNIPAGQITELADGAKNSFPTSKAVVENTISDFVATTRAQDRIIILFTGHAIDIDNEAYLVPVDGNRDNPKTLIPLTWVYDKLAKCNCRQKLLILDVFRFPPARGEELPGAGAMTEDFDAKLLTPPTGVQVWASCIKDQKSIELERGSVFMQSLCAAFQDRLPGIQEPTNPLPLDVIVPKVNQGLQQSLESQKVAQISRLSGTANEEGGASYNGAEPLPPKLVLKAVTPGGGARAEPALIAQIMDEINRLPPVRASQKPVPAASLPAFSAKDLEDYNADYKSWPQLVTMAKDKSKYPLRAAVLEAISTMKKSEKVSLRESLTKPAGGVITPELKKMFAAGQKDPGLVIFEMEKALTDLKVAGEARDKESSKRWRANYDYAFARLQARLVYIYEYNYILAQVRSDSLPELAPGDNGWRVGSQTKVQVNEPKVKEMLKSIARTWRRIREENPGTPWAILADREGMTALGLVWRPNRE